MAQERGTPGPASKKRNSGDTKGYADENPGRHDAQAGKDVKKVKAAEELGERKSKR